MSHIYTVMFRPSRKTRDWSVEASTPFIALFVPMRVLPIAFPGRLGFRNKIYGNGGQRADRVHFIDLSLRYEHSMQIVWIRQLIAKWAQPAGGFNVP